MEKPHARARGRRKHVRRRKHELQPGDAGAPHVVRPGAPQPRGALLPVPGPRADPGSLGEGLRAPRAAMGVSAGEPCVS